MLHSGINADNSIFVLLSFEGPDPYSSAGGLGVRVTNLSRTLADEGWLTHLFFIGDPRGKGEEVTASGRLLLHRWCQWISEYYPNGVYQGEYEKINDFNSSIPPFVSDRIIRPAIAQDKLVIVMSEEWHTAEAVCRLSDQLRSEGLRDRVVMLWNANNTFGFDQINWPRLSTSATITTISRYMKHIMWQRGVNPLVIPNGIPKALFGISNENASVYLREKLNADRVATKIARWDPDKRWNTAVEAIAALKESGKRTTLLARGGIEPHGEEVISKAHSLGLSVKDVWPKGNNLSDYIEAVGGGEPADILNIRFPCPPEFLQTMYHVSDAVLANSGHEPFGLVGLETMAAGGIAFTGGTGEDYALHLYNAIVLETADPKEIEAYFAYLDSHPDVKEKIREAGQETALQFVWERIVERLRGRLENEARIQGILDGTGRTNPVEATDCVPAVGGQAILACSGGNPWEK
jgi:glycosyltransferase involved in cell wall biosynthesis